MPRCVRIMYSTGSSRDLGRTRENLTRCAKSSTYRNVVRAAPGVRPRSKSMATSGCAASGVCPFRLLDPAMGRSDYSTVLAVGFLRCPPPVGATSQITSGAWVGIGPTLRGTRPGVPRAARARPGCARSPRPWRTVSGRGRLDRLGGGQQARAWSCADGRPVPDRPEATSRPCRTTASSQPPPGSGRAATTSVSWVSAVSRWMRTTARSSAASRPRTRVASSYRCAAASRSMRRQQPVHHRARDRQ